MREVASLLGLKVVSSREGREVGTVGQVIVNLATGVLEGLIVGKGPSEKGVGAADIEALGADAVMIPTAAVAKHLSEVPALQEKRRDPAAGPREILTDTGKRLGVLGAVFIDPVTLKVAHYEASAGPLRDMIDGVLELRPMPGTVDGRDSVIVPSAAFEEAAGHPGGLRAGIAKVSEAARVQARQAAEGLDKGAERLKKGAAAVGDKAGEAAAKVKSAGGAAAAKVADVGKHAAEEVKEATEAAAEKVVEVGKHAVEEAKEAGEHAVDAVRHFGHDEEAAPAADEDDACGTQCEPRDEAPVEGAADEPCEACEDAAPPCGCVEGEPSDEGQDKPEGCSGCS